MEILRKGPASAESMKESAKRIDELTKAISESTRKEQMEYKVPEGYVIDQTIPREHTEKIKEGK